jgi:hypothetical protein
MIYFAIVYLESEWKGVVSIIIIKLTCSVAKSTRFHHHNAFSINKLRLN